MLEDFLLRKRKPILSFKMSSGSNSKLAQHHIELIRGLSQHFLLFHLYCSIEIYFIFLRCLKKMSKFWIYHRSIRPNLNHGWRWSLFSLMSIPTFQNHAKKLISSENSDRYWRDCGSGRRGSLMTLVLSS